MAKVYCDVMEWHARIGKPCRGVVPDSAFHVGALQVPGVSSVVRFPFRLALRRRDGPASVLLTESTSGGCG